MTTATITAFLYAGAIQQGATLDNWGGHIGFVAAVEKYAHAISDWLNAQPPGVLEYELIEDLGEWLIVENVKPPTVADVLTRFQGLYTA